MCVMQNHIAALSLFLLSAVLPGCEGNVVEGTSAGHFDTSGSSPTTTSSTAGSETTASTPGSNCSSTTPVGVTSSSTTESSFGSSETTLQPDMGLPLIQKCGILNNCVVDADCLPTQKCAPWIGWCFDPCTRECDWPCISATENKLGPDLCPLCDLSEVLEP